MRDFEKDPRKEYIGNLFPEESSSQKQSRAHAENLGLAQISVSPAEARALAGLIRLHGAKKFVEIGTLTGLSAQYIIQALGPEGQLWSFEKDPEHGRLAQEVFDERIELKNRIKLCLGDAREELPKIESEGPFDGIFIDGNKAAYFDYLQWAEKNLRPGGLILADNIFLSGAVWGGETRQKFSPKQIDVLRRFNARLADPEAYESFIFPSDEGLFVAIKL